MLVIEVIRCEFCVNVSSGLFPFLCWSATTEVQFSSCSLSIRVCCSFFLQHGSSCSVAISPSRLWGLLVNSCLLLGPWLSPLPDRFPAVNSLIQRINLRKRRDSLILGSVIGVCTILLLLYAFHWWMFAPLDSAKTHHHLPSPQPRKSEWGKHQNFHSLLVAGAVSMMSGASDGRLWHWAWAEAAVFLLPCCSPSFGLNLVGFVCL